MAGISSLQGGHQVAQRLRKTTLPLRSASLSRPPSSAATLKSLACCWRLGLMRSSSPAASTAGEARSTAEQINTGTMRRTDIHMDHRVYMAAGLPLMLSALCDSLQGLHGCHDHRR